MYFLDSGQRHQRRHSFLHRFGFHFGSMCVYHLQSSDDPAADYDEAYHRSGYDSAGSSAHGSLGM